MVTEDLGHQVWYRVVLGLHVVGVKSSRAGKARAFVVRRKTKDKDRSFEVEHLSWYCETTEMKVNECQIGQ